MQVHAGRSSTLGGGNVDSPIGLGIGEIGVFWPEEQGYGQTMTPLGMRRALLYRFPEFTNVKVVRTGWGGTTTYCQYRDGPIDDHLLREWVEEHRAAGTSFECIQVAELPADPDDLTRLHRTRIPQDVVEDAQVTVPGIHEQLRRRWPGVVISILDGHQFAVIVARGTSTEAKEDIRAALLVLIASDGLELRVEEESSMEMKASQPLPEPKLSASAQQQFDRDRELLEEYVQNVLEGESIPAEIAPLPKTSATFAKFSDGIDNLIHRLSLYQTVYVYMPTDEETFVPWVGTTLDEFLRALPSGRLVPVFGHLAPRYAKGFVDKILDAGAPRIVLPGEARLRCLHALTKEHAFLAYLAQMDESARRLHAVLRRNASSTGGLKVLLAYLDGLSDVALNARWLARSEHPIANAYGGLGKFLDDISRAATGRIDDRLIEFTEAFDVSFSCNAFSASPMCLQGHYLEPYLSVVTAEKLEDEASITLVTPEVITKVLLASSDIGLDEFATAFQGAAVERMQALMQSPLWRDGNTAAETIEEFNRELRHFNGARELDEAALLAGASTALLSGGTSLIATFAAGLARPVIERISPSLCDRFDAFMTKTPREGVLLAKIRRRLT